MYLRLHILFCSIFVVFCAAELTEWPKKIKVTDANQHEFGLPLGKVLRKDKRTGLYIPPPITDDFTPQERLDIQFRNKHTARNYCRVGPSLHDDSYIHDFVWKDFCHDSEGKDLCCGQTKCKCDLLLNKCACLSDNGEEFFNDNPTPINDLFYFPQKLTDLRDNIRGIVPDK